MFGEIGKINSLEYNNNKTYCKYRLKGGKGMDALTVSVCE